MKSHLPQAPSRDLERFLRFLRPQNRMQGTLCFPPASRCPPAFSEPSGTAISQLGLFFPFAMLPSHPPSIQIPVRLPTRGPDASRPDPARPSRKQAALSVASLGTFSLLLGHLLNLQAKRGYLFTSHLPPSICSFWPSTPSPPTLTCPTELQGVSHTQGESQTCPDQW